MPSTPSSITTLILRFRDLVTEPGGTITLHRKVLTKYPCVYWGWWNKLGERVPADVFQNLNGLAAAPGLTVLLFDSGREQIYRATLSQIRTAPDGARFPTPNRSRTPTYYRDQHYMAWFCFTSIDQDPAADPDEVLRRYTYERVDSFFETGESRYSPFYGKRVFSPAELRQQDRTIWFVRDSRPDDPSQEIQLLQPTSVAPYHFPNRAIEDDGDTFLWLSDLHLSEDHHNFPLKATTSRFDLAGALERDLKNMGVKRIAAVLISGDLTWSSAATEFHFVSEFLRGIKSWSKLDNYQFVLCPGNHDMTFSASPGELDSEVTAAAATARAGYARLYEDLYGLGPNDYLSLGRRFLLARGIPVEIASINSSLLDQIEGAFQGHGFVGEQQLADLARQLRWDEGGGTPRALRIAMLHHHVVPITYREIPQQGRIYSVALDAGALTRWAARHRVDMILHGHMHQPAAARLQVPLSTTGNLQDWHEVQIIGMGSTGVARGELGEIGRNTFGLIRFKSEGVALSIYTIDPVRPREVTDPPYFEIQVSYPRWP